MLVALGAQRCVGAAIKTLLRHSCDSHLVHTALLALDSAVLANGVPNLGLFNGKVPNLDEWGPSLQALDSAGPSLEFCGQLMHSTFPCSNRPEHYK